MAAVHGPSIPHHPDAFRNSQNHNIPRSRAQFNPAQSIPPPKPAQTQQPSATDVFYGHEQIARLCARFITHLFACPEGPPVTTTASHAKLPYFIAYALHRTKLHPSVTFAALVLLQRLKARFPTARGSSGHRLFISAFMIASKVICDDTYSNKSWTIVGQNMFALREINQMEREMCSYLEWELNVEPHCLKEFERLVRKDFSGVGPYPTYTFTAFSSKSAPAVVVPTAAVSAPTPPGASTSPIPSFGQRQPSPPKPLHPPPPSTAFSAGPVAVSGGAGAYITPPHTPDTPASSRSAASSPASSAPPATPPTREGADAHIAIAGASPAWSLRSPSEEPMYLKGKIFAYAAPAVW